MDARLWGSVRDPGEDVPGVLYASACVNVALRRRSSLFLHMVLTSEGAPNEGPRLPISLSCDLLETSLTASQQ